MQALRDAPGYADMEDYYDSDYVPHELIRRYDALQQERRTRTEQQFIAATQAHALATTTTSTQLNNTVDSTHSWPSATHRATSERFADGDYIQRQQPTLRSSLRSPQRRDTAGHTLLDHSSAPRQAPRTSVALDEIYAARAISHGFTGSASTLNESDQRGVSGSRSTPPPLPASSQQTSPSPGRGTTTKTPAAPSSQKDAHAKKLKHQQKKQKPTKPSVDVDDEAMPRDLYDSAAEARRQELFFSESKRLGKPFVPSGGGGSTLDVPTRFMLGDCVKILYRSIVPDWREASPMVVSTAEDLIAVYFSLEKLEKTQVTALLQYMNASLLHNSAIREFHLTKVPEGWDVLTNDGYVLYTFRPPWVKKRVFLPDTVNPLHAHLREGED